MRHKPLEPAPILDQLAPPRRSPILIATFLLASCRSSVPPPPATAAASYVDPRTCAGCHREIAESYAQTGMGRSALRATAGNRVEDLASRNRVVHGPSASIYTMTAGEGAIHFRRHQTAPGGGETNVMEKDAPFILGSGNHARTYVARNAEGKLMEMPVSWYAEKGGYWAMSPGFDRPDHEDFRRPAAEGCLFCHAAYPQGSNSEPQPIDCQRCHGPGSAHVEAAAKGQTGGIVNPAKLSRDRQLELCMQCHLETTSSPLPNAIRRLGRDVYSYRPGEPLEDYTLHFDHAAGSGHDGKFEIAHAVYRLRKSACFLKSQMTCRSCHDPHRVPRGQAAETHYRTACLQCHQAAHNQNASCSSCHMPKRRSEDAVHVVMTDHYIQRSRPAGDLLAARREPVAQVAQGEVALYYPAKLATSPESEAYLALAQVQHGANVGAGLPRLEAAVRELNPPGPDFYFELARAYSRAGKEAQAVGWYEEALKRRGDHALAIKGLSAALITLGRLDEAAALLGRVPQPDASMLTNHGHALLKRGRADEAARMLERALAVNPETPEALNLLGMALLGKGDAAGAEARFREAIRVQPDLAAAHGNLANLLAARQDLAGAKFHFERSLERNPADAEVRRNYAFLLILLKNPGGARQQLEEAVRLDPRQPQARVELADLLEATGNASQAAEQYRAALELKPDLAEAHLGLGMLLLKRGDRAGARAHLEKAATAGNPEVSRQARQALGY